MWSIMAKSAADLSSLLKFRTGYFSSAVAFFWCFSTIHEIARLGPKIDNNRSSLGRNNLICMVVATVLVSTALV
jgi:hypothetical protein